ncbi:proteophosphoglycan ppg4 [uncultured Ramlibacter sp.]|jgi:hypothetical protein|uniref:proteophosphoglycan ppg4 n=1 Tax=uncultured Ramlibacter sp. TaxID=260755 RepID=UPI00261F9DC3|nr:proteophosphoglycan ppg4 [uncultured Ramlibacter sp.]
MNASHIKGLLAGLAAVAVVGTAVAQSTPPNSNVTNPAVGAGQQSSQGTPMGTTGVQSSTGSTAGSTAAAPAGSSTTSSSTMGASSDTTTTPRAQRADRN